MIEVNICTTTNPGWKLKYQTEYYDTQFVCNKCSVMFSILVHYNKDIENAKYMYCMECNRYNFSKIPDDINN